MSKPVISYLKYLLLPVSVIYGMIVWIRNWCYDLKIFKTRSCDIPVIVVGNITVGGTGKTPHVEYLVELLRKSRSVTVLSRGYKRKTKGFLKAGPGTQWTDVGDEPFQIWQKFKDIDVVVDKNRLKGIQKIHAAGNKNGVVILDDGFQHRSLKPGLSVLLIDYNRPLSGDYYLPFGRLRESRYEFRRADIVLFTKCPETLQPIEERIRVKALNPFPYQQVFFTTLIYKTPVRMFDRTSKKGSAADFLKEYSAAVIVAGIANPSPLVKEINKYISEIQLIKYRDHYAYRGKDIEYIEQAFNQISAPKKLIVTTEKDAVRLRSLGEEIFRFSEHWYILPVGIRFLQESEQEEFNQIILNYVKKDKGNNWLHQKKV